MWFRKSGRDDLTDRQRRKLARKYKQATGVQMTNRKKERSKKEGKK